MGGNSLSISGRGTAREKHFKPLAFGLMLSGQVKSLFGSKQTFIDSVSSQKHRRFQANTDYLKYLSVYVTVPLDQRKQKYTEFLKEPILIVC